MRSHLKARRLPALLLTSTLGLALTHPAFSQSPEGFGENTTGGLGHPTVHVTTLQDNDPNQAVIPGSLRAALSGGDRIVVFDVGGEIFLKSKLNIRVADNITVDGSTAPAPGITLRHDQFEIRDAHNIIIRHLRLRDTADKDDNTPGFVVFRTASDIWFDHLSASRISDDSILVFGGDPNSGAPTDVTVSWCLVFDALHAGTSGKGLLISGPGDPNANPPPGKFADGVTVHHNLLTNNPERNPQVSGNINTLLDMPTVDIRNNIIHNWLSYGTRIRTNGTGNLVKNLYRSTNGHQPGSALILDRAGPVFTSGNEAPPQGSGQVNINTLGTTQMSIPAPPITEDAVQDLPAALLGDGITTGVGALPRDAVDANAIARVAADLTALQTCALQGGTGCAFGSTCNGGTFKPSKDFGSLCCVGGTCLGPPGADTDGDGVEDTLDNCPTVYNPGQQDADGDALGDACDACVNDPANDADRDGVCGNLDNCPAVYNPGQQDGDLDGLADACDNCPAAYNPGQADADGDQAGDVCDLMLTFPFDGDVHCTDLPPVVTWLPKTYDRFRVFIGSDPNFRIRVTSGKRLLTAASWPVPARRWTRICTRPGATLYFKVFGKKAGTRLTEFSPVEAVTK